MVTPPDIEAQILRLHHAEKWTIGTIARELHIHNGVVRRVLTQAGVPRIGPKPRKSLVEVFPNAACVVSLVDRLVHNAEIVAIDGESYRLKEAHDRTEQRARRRTAKS